MHTTVGGWRKFQFPDRRNIVKIFFKKDKHKNIILFFMFQWEEKANICFESDMPLVKCDMSNDIVDSQCLVNLLSKLKY
jgi:hypothetical protein